MDADFLLSQLEKVRPAGDRAWMACCPHHDDKSPSMRVADKGDRILLHCYAGCDVSLILTSMGLSWSDLFADKERQHWTPRGPRLDPATTEYDEAKMTLQMVQNKRDRGEHLNGLDLLEEQQAGLRMKKYLPGLVA